MDEHDGVVRVRVKFGCTKREVGVHTYLTSPLFRFMNLSVYFVVSCYIKIPGITLIISEADAGSQKRGANESEKVF